MTVVTSSRTKRLRAEWLVFLLVTLLIGLLLAWLLHRERLNILAQEGDRLDVQTRVVGDNLLRQLDGAAKALAGITGQLTDSFDPSGSDLLAQKLKLLTDAMPGVSTMIVLDKNGTIAATSRGELLGKNFQQRDYFAVPRHSNDPSLLFVSPPFKTAVNTFVVVTSRTWRFADGTFAGVVAASLDPEYFDALIRSIIYAPDMRTALIHGDGQVFIGIPPHGKQRNDVATGSLVTEGSHSLMLRDDQLVATRRIDRDDLHLNKAMFVTASRELKALYAPWWTRLVELVALCAVLLAGAGVTLSFSQRRRLADADAALAVRTERQLAAERVELALRGADLGLWDLHVPTDTFVVNAREREILGFGPDDALPQGPAWRERIHPDDRAAVDASIIPHLRGTATSYECEHRMLRADGEWIWVFARAMIVERDEKRRAVRIVGTHLDVTERRAARQRLSTANELLQNSEAQLRQIADNLPALVSRFDNRQRLRFVNRAYQEWLHVEPSNLLGRSLREIYGDQSYGQFQHHIEAALKGERVVYQHQMPTPDGVRHVEVTLVPDTDEQQVVRGGYALIQDITARHKAESDRARSEARLSLALEGSSQALFDWDILEGTMYHSAQAATMRGDPAIDATLTMEALREFIHPDDLKELLDRMMEAVKGVTASYSAEYRIRGNFGAWIWVRARGRVVERSVDGRALRLVGTYADITDRKITEGRLRRLAERDPLTDLPNRALFHDRLEQAMLRTSRGRPMALLYLDIDHFKGINDTRGHEAGDEVLKVFADRMRRTVRRSDTVARLAGDEFTIILESLTDPNDACHLAKEIVDALREPIAIGREWLKVTVSVGVAYHVRGTNCSESELLRKADAALYEAKRRGRNGYCVSEMVSASRPPGYAEGAMLRLVSSGQTVDLVKEHSAR